MQRHRKGVLPVFALRGVVGVEILVTYSRLPLSELYHVSGGGIGLRAGRTLSTSAWIHRAA